MLIFFLGILQLVRFYTNIGAGFLVAGVQWYTILDVNAITRHILLGSLHIIADLALEAHIRHETVAGFWVDTRHTASIGVAVGIAVLYIEQQHKFITVFDGFRHFLSPPF